MLLFNDSYLQIMEQSIYFNTSNVTIQLFFWLWNIFPIRNFNTSNVTIQLNSELTADSSNIYFNTSNVTIQPFWENKPPYIRKISIHLMLLFNSLVQQVQGLRHNFNTSNVTIQRRPLKKNRNIKRNFNTSNVTIQRNLGEDELIEMLFQYI